MARRRGIRGARAQWPWRSRPAASDRPRAVPACGPAGGRSGASWRLRQSLPVVRSSASRPRAGRIRCSPPPSDGDRARSSGRPSRSPCPSEPGCRLGRPAMWISPDETSSSPAIIRSRVDLPQPEGPRMTTNSPSSNSAHTSWTTWVRPYSLLMPRSSTKAIIGPLVPFSASRSSGCPPDNQAHRECVCGSEEARGSTLGIRGWT